MGFLDGYGSFLDEQIKPGSGPEARSHREAGRRGVKGPLLGVGKWTVEVGLLSIARGGPIRHSVEGARLGGVGWLRARA